MGAEQKVFLKENGRTVLKVNAGLFHATWLEFFMRFIFHAALFPETSYTLTRFTNANEKFSAVVEQPWVNALRGATRFEVETYLKRVGFAHIRHSDYYSENLGLLLEDLHDENVLVGTNENILFIDPVIYLEIPDLNLGGPFQFLFPF